MSARVLRMIAVTVLCAAPWLAASHPADALNVGSGAIAPRARAGLVGGEPSTQVVPIPLPDYYDSLTTEEKKAVPTLVEITTSARAIWLPARARLGKPTGARAASTAAVTCATASTFVRGSNSIWGTIYTYKMVVDWCYNGSRVTWYSPIREYPNVAYWPSVAGWEFTQNISKDQWQPGGTTWYVRNYLKGEFRYCPIRIGACVETDYPWIYLDLNGAGGYARTAGGY